MTRVPGAGSDVHCWWCGAHAPAGVCAGPHDDLPGKVSTSHAPLYTENVRHVRGSDGPKVRWTPRPEILVEDDPAERDRVRLVGELNRLEKTRHTVLASLRALERERKARHATT